MPESSFTNFHPSIHILNSYVLRTYMLRIRHVITVDKNRDFMQWWSLGGNRHKHIKHLKKCCGNSLRYVHFWNENGQGRGAGWCNTWLETEGSLGRIKELKARRRMWGRGKTGLKTQRRECPSHFRGTHRKPGRGLPCARWAWRNSTVRSGLVYLEAYRVHGSF